MFKAILVATKAVLVLYILSGFNALIHHPNMKGLIYGGGHMLLGISGIYAIDDRFKGGIEAEESCKKEE
jgi:hypothetical protein